MPACFAISTTISWAKVRIMMACTMRSRFLATSCTDSRLPRLISAGERYSECPPSCSMPTSNVTRVRNDGFSKIMASVLPFSAPEKMVGLALTWQATCRICRICCGVKSRIERKSLGTMLPLYASHDWLVRFRELLQQLRDRGFAHFLHFVTYPHARLVQPNRLCQIDGCRYQHEVARDATNRLLQLMALHLAVAHGRQHYAKVGELLERLLNGSDRERPRIDQFGRAETIGCHHSRSVRHFAMRERRTVFDHQHSLTFDQRWIFDADRAGGFDDLRRGVVLSDVLPHDLHRLGIGGINFVNDQHMRAAEVNFPGIIRKLVSRAMRIENNNVEIGLVERSVIVASVPQNDVALLFGLMQDVLVIDTRINRRALHDVRLIFLTLFDGALISFEVGEGGKAFRTLGNQIAVRHGMTDHDWVPIEVPQFRRDATGDGTLAATRANRAHGNHRHFGHELRVVRAQQPEIRSGGRGARGQMHQRSVGHIGIGEHHDVNALAADDFFHPAFFDDRNTHGIQRARQLRRIMASCNVWDLCCGEGDYFKFRVVAKDYVEIMEISSSSTKDEDSFHFRREASLDP